MERYWLLYTPVWGAISAVVMIGGFVERWGDLGCMIYGIALAAGAIAVPLVLRVPEERDEPIHRRAVVGRDDAHQRTILLSGYSTIPSARAALRRGIRSRTVRSSMMVLTATHWSSLNEEIVGR